jgi:hypothetical protein
VKRVTAGGPPGSVPVSAKAKPGEATAHHHRGKGKKAGG